MKRELWIGDYQTTVGQLVKDAIVATVLVAVLWVLYVLAVAAYG